MSAKYEVADQTFDNFYDVCIFAFEEHGLEFCFEGEFDDLTEEEKQNCCEALDKQIKAVGY